MIAEHHVQRSPEECCRHLLLEVVLAACNDWLVCRERNWRPASIKGKFPNPNEVAELRMFFIDGWIDRLLHMAGSRLCGDRILSALESKARIEFTRKKSADRSSESNMLHGSDEVCIMTGESDTPIGGSDMLRVCTAWLEKREDGFVKKGWNDSQFNNGLAKRKRSNQTIK